MAVKQIQRRERRELNSHENDPQARSSAIALTRPRPLVENSLISSGAGVSAGQSKLTRTPPPAAKDGKLRCASASSISLRMREQEGRHRLVVLRAVKDSIAEAMRGSKQQGAERHAGSATGAADADYRDCSCRSARREAEWSAYKNSPSLTMHTVLPNTSLNLRANGMPPGPRHSAGVHYL